MKAPDFWFRPARVRAHLLAPIGSLWGAVCGWRMERAPRGAVSKPVICVGNLTVGGAGKTPTALALAQFVRALNLRPGFLSRGYGGANSETLLVDPARHRAADVGDEPLLLAANGPTVISADRVAGARMLADLCDAIIMDDGFHNPDLRKTLSLIVYDSDIGLPNVRCIPAGPLRAPLGRQMRHADAIVAIGHGAAPDADLPVFTAKLIPDAMIDTLRRRPVLVFAGIGRPSKFFDMLSARGVQIAEKRAFGDHHAYTPDDAKRILEDAERGDLALATTAKDAVRLAGDPALEALRDRALVVNVTLAFDAPDRITDFLTAGLEQWI